MPGILPISVLWTLLQPLASLLLPACKGNDQAAFEAATDTVMADNPRTPAELRAVIRLAIMDIEINQAYAQASTPGLTLLQAGRLRNGATAMVREAGKIERHLEQLRARYPEALTATPEAEAAPEAELAPEAEATPEDRPESEAEPATSAEVPNETTTEAPELSWSHPYKQRKHERRLAAQAEREARMQAQAQANQLPEAA